MPEMPPEVPPDFAGYVRRHLLPLGLSGAQTADMVDELALELEERYARAIRNGEDPHEAWQNIRERIPWSEISADLRSVFRDDMPPEPLPEGGNNMLSNWL